METNVNRYSAKVQYNKTYSCRFYRRSSPRKDINPFLYIKLRPSLTSGTAVTKTDQETFGWFAAEQTHDITTGAWNGAARLHTYVHSHFGLLWRHRQV